MNEHYKLMEDILKQIEEYKKYKNSEMEKKYDERPQSYHSITIEPKSDEDIIEELREQLKKEKAKCRKLRKELKAEKLNTMKAVAAEEKEVAKALKAMPVNRLGAVE